MRRSLKGQLMITIPSPGALEDLAKAKKEKMQTKRPDKERRRLVLIWSSLQMLRNKRN